MNKIFDGLYTVTETRNLDSNVKWSTEFPVLTPDKPFMWLVRGLADGQLEAKIVGKYGNDLN